MISVGSRDGNKGLSSRYGVEGGKMELDTEIEEGEACFQNNNGDDSAIDLDVSLSYIDEKIQNVLGHCQKDFEGGVSAENLGAKFGGYGSFLPTYQRSPVWPHPKTPPKVLTYEAYVSPNNAHIEVGHQNFVSQTSASQAATNGPSMNGKLKQHVSNDSDQKSLKVRIKVGSDNMLTRRNAELYSGLGLDVSPSSSFEGSPVNSDGFLHMPRDGDGPRESPTSILEIMTSFPVCGSLLLSPLPYDVLHLTENEKGSQESTLTALHGSDSGKEKKPKYVALDIAKEEPLDQILTRDDRDRNDGSVGKISEAKNTNCNEKKPFFTTKADSDASNGSKTRDSELVKPAKGAQKAMSREKDKKKSKNGSRNGDFSKGGLKNDSSSTSRSKNNVEDLKKNNGKARETYKDFFGEIDLEHEDDYDNMALEKPSRVGKGTPESNSSSKERLIGKKNKKRSSSVAAETVGSDAVPTITNWSVPGAATATTGSHAVPTTANGPVSDSAAVTVGSHVVPTITNGSVPGASAATVGSHAVPTMANGSVLGAAAATVAPLVNEDWVCCDKCEKWRLLPPGVNPGSLPEKWLCSMLDWLPGMNRCSISEEETTKAMTSRFPGPTIIQGSLPVHPGAPCLDQTHQLFGSQAPSLKKTHEPKDVSNETKPDRPSLSSNSAKKNLQTSYKSRSLNGANGSSVNGVEFQDSGRSNVIAEKHRLKKHKENVKLRENFVDEGVNSNNNIHQSKISNKREMIQDYPRDRKKIKTDKDWSSDHGGAVFKASCSSSSGSKKDRLKHSQRPKDTKSLSKVSAINPEKQNEMSSNDETSKKRKANEFVEETSETDNKKEKKSRVLLKSKSDEKGKNVKDEQVMSLDVIDSSRRNAGPVHATSSSSKVSGSRKTKPDKQGTKGSPGESVSSSPLRILNRDKVTSSTSSKVNPKKYESLNENIDIPHQKDLKDVRIEAKCGQDMKKPSKPERGKLPPSGKVQNEMERLQQPVYRKENARNTSEQNKKTQNQNGNQTINIKHPTPSPPRRETSNQIATNALREATNLKHMADRVKNTGSNLDSRALYMQAALKFLQVASLFESCHSQTGRYGDMIQSMSIYSSTAKLCEYCAHEYEKTKEMATAALAYKCVEVAYLKVVYSSHMSACKDLHELQNLGESPSSSASASDLDNLNNPTTIDKTTLPKGVNSPQVAANHIITTRNKPNFTRILNFAQDVNLAMEASRKSRTAFASSGLKEETSQCAVKTALDFNFHDVDELLRLVRLAMEVISR